MSFRKHRSHVPRSSGRKYFSKHASHVHPLNARPMVMRGGFRL